MATRCLRTTAIALVLAGCGNKDAPPTPAASPTPPPPADAMSPPVDAASEDITVEIDSIPSAALVVRKSDGKQFGLTPLTLKLVRSNKKLALVLKSNRPAVLPHDLTIPLDKDGKYVVAMPPVTYVRH